MMGRRTVLAVVCVVLAAGVLVGCKSPKYKGPPVTLKLKYQPGTYNMTMDMKGDMEVSAGGQSQDMDMAMTMYATMKVDEPDAAGAKKMRVKFTRMKQSVSMGKMKMSFDSAVPGSNPQMAQAIAPLLEAEITATIGPEGQPQDISGLEEMFSRLDPQAAQQLKQQFSPEQLKQMMGSDIVLPKKPVKPGDTWEGQMPLPLPGMSGGTAKYKYELEDIDEGGGKKIAIINVEAEFGGSGMSLSNAPGAKMGKMDFSMEGVMRFDIDLGMVVGTEAEVEADIEASGPSGGMEMTMDMDVDMKVEKQ